MRRNYLPLPALIVASALLLQAGCQKPAEIPKEPRPAPTEVMVEQQKVKPTKPTAKIVFEKVVHDYGEVGPGTDNVGEFRFTNKGDALLLITGVKDCCGMRTTLTKRQYAPGESGVLKAKFHAFSIQGVMRREIHVYSNDPAKRDVALTVKAKVVPKVAFKPHRLNLLLKGENAAGPEITLTSLDGKSFSIKQFRASGNCMSADIDPAVEATRFVLQPKVDIEKLQKGSGGHLIISLTHPECREVTIPFATLSRFKITPPQIIVLRAEPKKPVARKVWVLSNYREDFEVESTSSQKNIIKVLNQKKISSGYQFDLEITPPDAKEQRRFTDAFVVNLTGGHKLTIMCRGFY